MTPNKTYWLSLAERYFEGTTTNEEERLLRSFLRTPEAQSPEFEELRAVMGFLAVGKVMHKKKAKPFWRNAEVMRWSAAACFVIIGGMGAYHLMPKNIYVAYVDGKRITDKQEVFAGMHLIMDDIHFETPTSTMEANMSDLLNTLNTEE